MKSFSLWLLTVLILVGLSGTQVKHAPTIEQCQADQRLWLARLEGPESGLRDIAYKELHGWQGEMMECESVNAEFRDRYYNTSSEIDAVIERRFMHFIVRHSLWEQFLAEDARGER